MTLADNVMKNFQLLHNSLQRALAESENIISDMRSKLDIVNAEKTASNHVDRWMKCQQKD